MSIVPVNEKTPSLTLPVAPKNDFPSNVPKNKDFWNTDHLIYQDGNSMLVDRPYVNVADGKQDSTLQYLDYTDSHSSVVNGVHYYTYSASELTSGAYDLSGPNQEYQGYQTLDGKKVNYGLWDPGDDTQRSKYHMIMSDPKRWQKDPNMVVKFRRPLAVSDRTYFQQSVNFDDTAHPRSIKKPRYNIDDLIYHPPDYSQVADNVKPINEHSSTDWRDQPISYIRIKTHDNHYTSIPVYEPPADNSKADPNKVYYGSQKYNDLFAQDVDYGDITSVADMENAHTPVETPLQVYTAPPNKKRPAQDDPDHPKNKGQRNFQFEPLIDPAPLPPQRADPVPTSRPKVTRPPVTDRPGKKPKAGPLPLPAPAPTKPRPPVNPHPSPNPVPLPTPSPFRPVNEPVIANVYNSRFVFQSAPMSIKYYKKRKNRKGINKYF